MSEYFLKFGDKTLGNPLIDPKVVLKGRDSEIMLSKLPSLEDLEKMSEFFRAQSPTDLLSLLLNTGSFEEMVRAFEEYSKAYGVESVEYTEKALDFSSGDGEIFIPLESATNGYLGALVLRGSVDPKFFVEFLQILDAFISLSEGFILAKRSKEILESSLDVLADALGKRIKGGEEAKRIREDLFRRFGDKLFDRPDILKLALSIYDVGKIGVRDSILSKSDFEMTPEEFDEYRKHPEYGYEILKNIEELPKEILDAVLYHHERIDGSGYPKGLRGRDIPRIALVVGFFDEYALRKIHGESDEYIEQALERKFPPDILEVLRGG